jgi:hypothetical protein
MWNGMLPQRYGVFQRDARKTKGAGWPAPPRPRKREEGECGGHSGPPQTNECVGPATSGRLSYWQAGYGRTTLFASTPIFSTSASMRSPALRKLPVAAPTPSGVPVAMMSPASTVMPRERTSMH